MHACFCPLRIPPTSIIELREKVHEDKKDAKGWPLLDSKKSLIEILTTVQWILLCKHAAVNFDQFDEVGHMQHLTIIHQFIPEESTAEWKEMIKNPKHASLLIRANIDSTTIAMSMYKIQSVHSLEAEYIGHCPGHKIDNKEVEAAF